MDEASSKARLKSFMEPESIKNLEKQVEKMEAEKENAIHAQDFEKAAQLRDESIRLKHTLEEEKMKWHKESAQKLITIGLEEIAEVVSRWTGIPVMKITQDETTKLKQLESILHQRVVGQEKAIEAVAKAIRRSRVGLKDPNRPIGSFLFLGPTGVGKTELTKALAETLFENENTMIRLDMSEYMESHSVSKMIGSPPGYVGYDEAGWLTEKVRKNPYAVVLFDEIEKAHPDIMNVLLQILEDGRLTDSQGRTVDFKNTVIIMTSNIGARLMTEKKTIGFENQKEDLEKEAHRIQKEVLNETKKELKPEFLNRIDEIIVFHSLSQSDLQEITNRMLRKVIERMKKQDIELEITESARAIILQHGTNVQYGARPLRRSIQNLIEDKIAEGILTGRVSQEKKIVLDGVEEEIIFR